MAKKLKPKRRALYKFICKGCGKKRSSLKWSRAITETCALCRRNKVPDNQPAML